MAVTKVRYSDDLNSAKLFLKNYVEEKGISLDLNKEKDIDFLFEE